jgi:transcriptional regulator with XRE-family HTH domain
MQKGADIVKNAHKILIVADPINANIASSRRKLRPTEDVMAILNGKALLEARRKKGWTQVELSEATKPKIDISTVSRIERGKSNRVRAGTLRALAQALDVHPESLCPTVEAERDVMKLRIESAARNALTLVALRYRISRESIVEVAPLLFFIAAEQCLQERQKRIAEVRASADALFDLQRGICHLPAHWPVDESAMTSEEQSIKARDLFGKKVLEDEQQFMSELDADYDDAEQNPFVAYLRDTLAKVSSPPEVSESVRWPPGLWPGYEICTEEAAKFVGDDAKATHAIVCGAAALHEMPKGSPEQRAEWARAEFRRKYGDLQDLLSSVTGLSPADDQAPSSGATS